MHNRLQLLLLVQHYKITEKCKFFPQHNGGYFNTLPAIWKFRVLYLYESTDCVFPLTHQQINSL